MTNTATAIARDFGIEVTRVMLYIRRVHHQTVSADQPLSAGLNRRVRTFYASIDRR